MPSWQPGLPALLRLSLFLGEACSYHAGMQSLVDLKEEEDCMR